MTSTLFGVFRLDQATSDLALLLSKATCERDGKSAKPQAPSHKLDTIEEYKKIMKVREALKITGSLSQPSKMPGWAYGLPAKECKTGGKLQKVPGSVCYDCYALKGCYVFKVVQDAQYKRLAAIRHPLWTGAMAKIINSKKSKFFRWHDSGDVQDEDHLIKIFSVCRLTPTVKHWMPTREAWVKAFLSLFLCLTIVLSHIIYDVKLNGNA